MSTSTAAVRDTAQALAGPGSSRARKGRRIAAVVAVVVGAAMVAAGAWLGLGHQRVVVEADSLPAPVVAAPSQPAVPVTPQPSTAPAQLAQAGAPIRISVPKLGRSADVLPIAVAGGVLTPPANSWKVGWDKQTAVAGAAYGSTVITGHTVHDKGAATEHGAMQGIDALTVGDQIVVETAKGVITYDVTSVADYDKSAMADQLKQLYDTGVPGRLVLITCTDWNGAKHLQNTVVVATPRTDAAPASGATSGATSGSAV